MLLIYAIIKERKLIERVIFISSQAKYRSPKLPHEKVLRDPVHNYVYIQHQVILQLINTKEFQRLRRIRQLGVANLTFHGAEHSRFTHSVGVYEITRRICDLFARKYPTRQTNDGLWDDNERLVALCAGLLHDIGHGPYSHTFEHIFHTDHEALTRQILLDESTEVNHVLRQVAPDFPEQVASVIKKTYPNQQVVQMISSQIDADRMDYLLRDSYYTGTNYGTFDLTRILRLMRPYAEGITFDISAMHAVEDYIVSRFQMYQQVYFHPVSRSMEVILAHLLLRAKELYEQGHLEMPFKQDLLAPFFENNFSIQDYLRLDDGVLNTYFNYWATSSDPVLADLAQRFLNRHPFKYALVPNAPAAAVAAAIHHLQGLVKQAGFNPKYYTAINDSFDLPYDAYAPEAKKATRIELMQKDGSTKELSEVSQIVQAIKGRQIGDKRFFFPKELIKPTAAALTVHPDLAAITAEFHRNIVNDYINLGGAEHDS